MGAALLRSFRINEAPRIARNFLLESGNLRASRGSTAASSVALS
jgi:hypothetical protein